MANHITQVSLDEFKDACRTASSRFTEIITHHTWSPRTVDYRGKSTWNSIRSYHVNIRGWSDIGYHAGVGPDNSIWLLRHSDGGGYKGPLAASGAHCVDHNSHGLGLVMIGDFDTENPLTNGYNMLTRVMATFMNAKDIPISKIWFHRNYANKTCPGTRLKLPEVRQDVADIFGTVDDSGEFDPRPDVPHYAVVIGSMTIDCKPKIYDDRLFVQALPYAKALGADEIPADVHIHESGYVLAMDLTQALDWELFYRKTDYGHRFYPKHPDWITA